MLVMLVQFTQSECWSPDRLRQAQFMQLAQLLRHSRATVPFYRDCLRFPWFGEYEFGSVPALRQFQVVQKTFDDIEVALVVARPLTADEEDTLRALILKNLGHSFRLVFSYRDEIPRAASGKFEDFRCEVVA